MYVNSGHFRHTEHRRGAKSSTMASATQVETGGHGQGNLQLINRLNESRSPYVSPHCVTSRPTMKMPKLRGLSHRSGNT